MTHALPSRCSLAVVTVSASAMALTLLVQPAQAGGRPLETQLTGAAEVPGPGDPDGSGTVSLTVNPGLGEICYEIEVSGIAPATAAHIHVGTTVVAGPVVVPLEPPVDGTSDACVAVDRELALAILQDPDNYYVNVHNAEFPAGALRGQLG
jgi:hypothetical protein